MQGWKVYKLGDLTEWKSGGTPSKNNEEFWGGNIPWISAKTFNSSRIYDSEIKITELGLNNGSRMAKIHSLLLLVRGSGLFNSLPVGIVLKPVAFNQDIKSIEALSDIIDPYFLLYWFKGNKRILEDKLEFTGIGAGKFDTQILKNIDVKVPPKYEQRQIVEILTALDDKIELNNQINANLEALAQTLFKQWFVDFEFPDENGQPYKSSGGEMVDSELGEIPKGWGTASLLDTVDLWSGGTPKTDVKEFWDGEINWISAKDVTPNHKKFIIETERSITGSGLSKSSAKLLPKYSTVITSRGTVGNFCIIPVPMAISQSNYALKSNKDFNFYTFLLVSTLINSLKQKSYGTVFDTITTKILKEIKVVNPNNYVLEKFELLVCEKYSLILNNSLENKSLMSLRDSLLPKLISGEINFNYVAELQEVF